MTAATPHRAAPERRPAGRGCLLIALAWFSAVPLAAAAPLRVCVVSDDGQAGSLRDALTVTLEKTPGLECTLTTAIRGAGGTLSLEPLRAAQAAVFHRGPGALRAEDAAVLEEFLRSGKNCVILGASNEAWTAVPGLLSQVLGGTPGEGFASGAPMSVINLFAHPIFAGVARFETTQAMAAYPKLADDIEMIMEGTVGEETTPLAWVRRRPAGRMCHVVPAGPDLLRDPAYRRIVGNAVLWTIGWPIPGAQAHVQRTFMPNSYPGAIAITFPNGPGVCLDPVRGGINYVWDGDFVDLRPRWLTKQGEPARIAGDVFYREKAWRPLRSGRSNSGSEYHFRGYSLQDGRPEFHYRIDGREVDETITASRDGTGIVRRFRVGPGRSPLWLNLEAQTGAEVALHGMERDGDRGCFPSAGAGEFTIEIRRRSGGTAP